MNEYRVRLFATNRKKEKRRCHLRLFTVICVCVILPIEVSVLTGCQSTTKTTVDGKTNPSTDSTNMQTIAAQFYRGDGLGFNELVTIEPDGTWKCRIHGCCDTHEQMELTGLARWIAPSMIEVKVTGGKSDDRHRSRITYLVAKWGERTYLVHSEEVQAFASACNRRTEPRWKCHGDYLMRWGDEALHVYGIPCVTGEMERLFLTNEVIATIVGQASKPVVIEEDEGEKWSAYQLSVRSCREKGIESGMILTVRSPERLYGFRFLEITSRNGNEAKGTLKLWEDEGPITADWCFTSGPGIDTQGEKKGQGEKGEKGQASKD